MNRSNAKKIGLTIKNCGLSADQALGNHDPVITKEQIQAGFIPLTHIFQQCAVPNTDIVICQPDISMHNNIPRFSYNADYIISVLEQTTNPHLIISSHWGFDRESAGLNGPGYQYQDNTEKINDYIRTRLNAGTLESVLTLHGHSHRFRHTKQDRKFDSFTMPSIVQNDIGHADIPCGIFVTVDLDQETGLLKPTFHRFVVDNSDDKTFDPTPDGVSYDYMRRYERGRKAFTY